jgi:hypothetical protein
MKTSIGAKNAGKQNFEAILPISQSKKIAPYGAILYTACYSGNYGNLLI